MIWAYLAGLLTGPAAAFLWLLGQDIHRSIAQWRLDEGLGKGLEHEAECRDEDRWFRTLHAHLWPTITPWWLIRLCEPIRKRRCLAHPDYRPIQEKK